MLSEIKLIERSSLEQYKDIDLTQGNTLTDEEPNLIRKKSTPGRNLTRLLAKHIIDEHKDTDFGFSNEFTKPEMAFVKE